MPGEGSLVSLIQSLSTWTICLKNPEDKNIIAVARHYIYAGINNVMNVFHQIITKDSM